MKPTAIRLRSESIPRGAPVVADLLDAELNLKWRGAVFIDEPVVLPEPLAEGHYAVVVALSSGRTVTSILNVTDQAGPEFDVVLPSKSTAGSDPAHTYPSGPFFAAASTADPSPSYGSLATTWARLWSRDADQKWHVRKWPTALPRETKQDVVRELETDHLPLGQHCIQVGSGSSQPRVTAILPGKVCLVLRPARRGDYDDRAEPAVDVDVYPETPAAQVLLGYLSHGDLERAQLAGSEVLARLGVDTARDPAVAISGAYYLLVFRKLVELEGLIERHLAECDRWLPDVAVIDAWRLLRQEPPSVEKARDRLIAAAATGVPVFTRGLRLLLDGLRMVALDKTWADGAVAHALERVRRFGQVADWSPPFSTYFAVQPDTPINLRVGMDWLTEAQQAARDPCNIFPWASAVADRRGEQASRNEMRSHLSAPFSRAFGYPPSADVDAAKKTYEEFRKTVENVREDAA
jgi:hypothetical protein